MNHLVRIKMPAFGGRRLSDLRRRLGVVLGYPHFQAFRPPAFAGAAGGRWARPHQVSCLRVDSVPQPVGGLQGSESLPSLPGSEWVLKAPPHHRSHPPSPPEPTH